MKKSSPTRQAVRAARAEALFACASREDEAGNYAAALRLYRAAVRAGDAGASLNIGSMYDLGHGVRRNTRIALHWYRRAYRHGSSSGAINIGTVWRDRGNYRRALAWFRRAVRMGNPEGHFEAARIYLKCLKQPAKAVPHLREVVQAEWVTEHSVEEAKRLLRRLSPAVRTKPA